MAVAIARFADGKVPPPRLAKVALASVLEVATFALTGSGVAEVVEGTDSVTVAC